MRSDYEYRPIDLFLGRYYLLFGPIQDQMSGYELAEKEKYLTSIDTIVYSFVL